MQGVNKLFDITQDKIVRHIISLPEQVSAPLLERINSGLLEAAEKKGHDRALALMTTRLPVVTEMVLQDLIACVQQPGRSKADYYKNVSVELRPLIPIAQALAEKTMIYINPLPISDAVMPHSAYTSEASSSSDNSDGYSYW